jgi:hypothetical protein
MDITNSKTLSYQPAPGVLDCSEMRGWEIAVSPQAILSENYAAEEFRLWFGKATGIQLPLRATIQGKPHLVCIGGDVSALDSGITGEEELQVIVESDRLIIVGGHPRGTLYGVYQFLEDFIGVRFLTYDHTHVPEMSLPRIPCGTYTYNPPFSFRSNGYFENVANPEYAARLRVNRETEDEKLGGKSRQRLINHSCRTLMPFAKYGADHPEYYALVNGKRDTDLFGGGPQLCVTNPEVVELASEAAIKQLDEHPEFRNVSVSQADTYAYCRCGPCEAINQREDSAMGAQLAFVNAVAERVEKAHPDAKVGTLAYHYSRKPPKTIRPRHNVQIQLSSIACCTLHPIDDPDCKKNREFCRDMDAWGEVCNEIWVWNYNINFIAYDLPFPNLRIIGPNVRYFLRNNAKGLFMQSNVSCLSGEFSDLRNYLSGKLMWDPHLDDRTILEEFLKLHYKSAAEPLMDYITMFHDNAEAKGVHPDCYPSAHEVGLNSEISQRIFDYFEGALALADDDAVRTRVEKASISAYRTMFIAGGEIVSSERAKLIDRYIDLCQRYEMVHLADGPRLTSEYFKVLKRTRTTHGCDRSKPTQPLIKHSFHWLVPFEKYGIDHPEYYALVDGKHETQRHDTAPQLCVTNPDVVKIAANAALKYLDEHPNVRIVSVSQSDADAYCQCDSCEQINQREGSPMGAQLAFVNAVAERVEEVHPDANVGTLAYVHTRKPPKGLRPRHNVRIQLSSTECCTLHTIDNPKCKNWAFGQDMYEWSRICNEVWVWNYNTNFHISEFEFDEDAGTLKPSADPKIIAGIPLSE